LHAADGGAVVVSPRFSIIVNLFETLASLVSPAWSETAAAMPALNFPRRTNVTLLRERIRESLRFIWRREMARGVDPGSSPGRHLVSESIAALLLGRADARDLPSSPTRHSLTPLRGTLFESRFRRRTRLHSPGLGGFRDEGVQTSRAIYRMLVAPGVPQGTLFAPAHAVSRPGPQRRADAARLAHRAARRLHQTPPRRDEFVSHRPDHPFRPSQLAAQRAEQTLRRPTVSALAANSQPAARALAPVQLAYRRQDAAPARPTTVALPPVQRTAPPVIDTERLGQQVWKQIERKLRIERERRGRS
jgi:hypothetical protein